MWFDLLDWINFEIYVNESIVHQYFVNEFIQNLVCWTHKHVYSIYVGSPVIHGYIVLKEIHKT